MSVARLLTIFLRALLLPRAVKRPVSAEHRHARPTYGTLAPLRMRLYHDACLGPLQGLMVGPELARGLMRGWLNVQRN